MKRQHEIAALLAGASWLGVLALMIPYWRLDFWVAERVPASTMEFRFRMASLALAPLFILESIRAARAFDDDKYVPWWILFVPLTLWASPLFMPRVVAVFGWLAWVVLAVAWPIVALYPLAFMVAAAQVASHKRGETVRYTAVYGLYHVGGFAGQALAKRLWPESPVFEEFPVEPPEAIWFIVLALVFCGIQVLPFVPRGLGAP